MAYLKKFSENGQDDNSRSSGDSSDPLPSHGLSELVGTAGACFDLLKRINDGKGLEPCSELPGPAFSPDLVKGESSSTNYDDFSRKRSASPVAMETGREPTAGTSTQGQFYAPFQFPAGGTEPLNGSTVDVTQLGMLVQNDDVLYEEPEVTCEMIEPKLTVITSEYTRFRYLSEKNKTNKKTRQYETDEDRRTLAEISVENYTGQAKVIVYCVHQNGDLHPYSLYGDDCEDGVYVKQINFGLRPSNLKLSKVSITTPVAKEYEDNVVKQRNFLEKTLGSENIDEKLRTEPTVSDKQVVRLMFKVILKDGSNITLTHLSGTIHNKKEGKEFRIDTIEPASAPAAGSQSTNVDKNRVLVVVTEDTAFPKDVGVVLRKEFENGQLWEEHLEKDQIRVIKKAVVKFIPPPFPVTTEDVEVELCLYDVKTKKETEPVRFLYTGIDEYGLMVKGKKRKLDENLAYLQHIGMSASAGGSSQAQRKTLQAVRTKTQTSSGSSSDSSSAENSLTVNQTGFAENRVISLEQTRGSSTSLPFATYSKSSPQQSYDTQGQQNQEYSLEEQAVFTLEGSQAAQQYQPAVSHNGHNLGANQNIAVVTSASSVFSSATVTEQSSSEYSPITTFSSGLSMYASLQGQQQQSQQQQQDEQQQQLLQVKNEEQQQLQKQLLQQLQNQQQQDDQAKLQTLMAGLQQQQLQQLQQHYSIQTINPAQQGSLTEDTLRQLLENSSSTEKRKLLKNLQQQTILSQQPPVRLPKLEANQQLAIIEGQICIINDDLSTSSPSPTVQDIAGQQVIVHPMITTQPSSAGAEEQPAVNPMLPSLQHWQNPTTTSYPSHLTQSLTTAYGLQTVEASSGINLMSQQQQTPPPSVADATRQTQQSQAATYQSQMYQLGQQQLAATGHQQQTMNAARQDPLFWRSRIPSAPCNLEDDDIEIDSGYTGAGQATRGKKMKSSDDNDKLYFDDELQVDVEVEVVGAGTYDRGTFDIDQTEDDVIVILAEEEKENSQGFNT